MATTETSHTVTYTTALDGSAIQHSLDPRDGSARWIRCRTRNKPTPIPHAVLFAQLASFPAVYQDRRVLEGTCIAVMLRASCFDADLIKGKTAVNGLVTLNFQYLLSLANHGPPFSTFIPSVDI